MIAGVGTDRVLIGRIQTLLLRWGDRFVARVLGPSEQAEFYRRRERSEFRAASYLAKRFAAKEAFGKALGCGLAHPMSLHSLEVLNTAKGAPYPVFHKALATHMQTQQLRGFVSLSDEQDAALAFAVVESALPMEKG
ncbi:MAG: holo-ACP synthase [Burkholderiaceae bacterium]|jgi:holo-[acyl-carrier protein] synthase